MTLTRAEFYELFEFLHSETPTELMWLREYVSKKSLMILDENLTLFQMKEQLYLQYQASNSSVEATLFIKSFAVKMYKAHKARLYRKKYGAKKMLNVTITPKHIQDLENICKSQSMQKNKVIEMMIDNSLNYSIISKQKLTSEKQHNKLIFNKLKSKEKEQELIIEQLKIKEEEQELTIEKLKENISSMFEIIREYQKNYISKKEYTYDNVTITYYQNTIKY